MASAVAALRPGSLWSRFDELTSVPRPSKKEERVCAWVREWATAHDFSLREDAAGNLLVVVPASAGRENAATVVLQAHLDMVCEKNSDVEHDFDRDPIRTRVTDGWVVAEGTTLGADNGIGVASAMAAAVDPEVKHGPLELLFTVDEESGMTGAANLDPQLLSGRILLNLDSEEDGMLCVGCAGGIDTQLNLPLEREPWPTGYAARRLTLQGLRGGHSGCDIHENRGNALRLLARVLEDARVQGREFALADFAGGDKPNAIPREAAAVVAIPAADAAAWEAHLGSWRETLGKELAGIDDALECSLQATQIDAEVLTASAAKRLSDLLLAIPHGVLAMSPAIERLVESSSNLAAVRCSRESARILCSSRSSLDPALRSIVTSLRACAGLAGTDARHSDGYPGWQPNPDSAVTEVLRGVYREIWGREPHVSGVHAGLECGLLGQRIPGLDMISFGPTITGAHSPDERVEIASVERFWRALKLALDRLSQPTR